MVSAEQRWNEGRRDHNRATQAFNRAARARTNAMYRARHIPNNAQVQANFARTRANYNRARDNMNAAVNKTRNAYRELLRKYHLPGIPSQFQNAVMTNIIRNEKARIRRKTQARTLSAVFPKNLANKIARLA